MDATRQHRLVIVSNRLPVKVEEDDDGKLRVRAGSGGLVTAMAPVLRDRGGVWLGWAGVDNERERETAELLATTRVGYTLRAVPLTRREVDDYYYGFANEVLWPLFHDLVSRCNFDPTRWAAYQSANERFAQAAAETAGADDHVWIHDYHLIGVGALMRRLDIQAPLGFFLHVPFPPLDIFLKLPWRVEILRAMLAYDLIGLQTRRDRRNFVQCVNALVPGVKLSGSGRIATAQVNGHTVRVGSFPIGIDFHDFARPPERLARAGEEPPPELERPAEHVVLGVDRLDYSKGIPQRLQAFADALAQYPDLRGRVSLIQVVVPSRTHIPEYRDLKGEIERLVGEINGRFTTPGWVPIHYVFRSLPRPELLAHYQLADVALVTPLKDGMNLVAKEYCAAHVDERGVLILSEFAGAAAQLQNGALMVNPHDVRGVADAIRRACTMPDDERRRRMRSMRRCVRERDVHDWLDQFLQASFGHDLQDFPAEQDYLPPIEALAFAGA